MKGNTYCHQICQQIYWVSPSLPAEIGVKVSKSTWQIYWQSDQICWQKWPPISASIVTDCQRNLLADLLIFHTNSSGRFPDVTHPKFCQQISLRVTKSAGRFTDIYTKSGQQTYWVSTKSASRNTGPPHFCLADLLKFTKSAGRYGDIHQMWQQKHPLISARTHGVNVTKSASRFGWLSVNLLADLLNPTKCCWQIDCGGQYFCWQI